MIGPLLPAVAEVVGMIKQVVKTSASVGHTMDAAIRQLEVCVPNDMKPKQQSGYMSEMRVE